MRRIILTTIIMFVCFSWIAAQERTPDWDQLMAKTDWKLFSDHLVKAIQSDNQGLQVSAMQHVIRYAGKVDVHTAAFKLIRIYRRNKDEFLRQLALVTIYASQNDYALSIVKRDYNFEKSEKIKRTMAAILTEQAKKLAKRKTGEEIIATVNGSSEQNVVLQPKNGK